MKRLIAKNMQDWATNEIEIAKARTTDTAEQLLYDSALQAYKVLINQGHSGFSWGAVCSILNDLCEGLPLTPITEDDLFVQSDEDKEQCNRMSSLFKYPDGTYNDVDRVTCFYSDSSIGWYNGFVTNLINELEPITLPYTGRDKIKVIVEEYLTDTANGDYDTLGVISYTINDKEPIQINRYFKEQDNEWVEIGENEFYKRKEVSLI